MPPQQQQTREDFIKGLFVLEKKDNVFHETSNILVLDPDTSARAKLIRGVNKVVDAVKLSYGAAGSNVIIEDESYPGHRVTNDGKLIAKSIKLQDPIENIGANIVKEVADKSDKESGDGRKTTMILLQAILKEGMKCKDDPMTIKRSLDECLPVILKSIDEQTKQITVDDIEGIARVASESESLGRTFGNIYKEIGKDGIVELDNSGTDDTYYTVTEGVRLLGCKYQYSYMADDTKKAVRNQPYVLITKEKINNISQLDSLFKTLYRHGKKDLVIFCDDIADEVSTALYGIHQGFTKEVDGLMATLKFNILVIKAPVLWKDWLFEDFSQITGATIIDGTLTKLKQLQLHHLGTCDKVITSKDETIVLGIKDIKNYIAKLSEDNTDEAKIRVARLNTKTAILKLGANSESELSYIRGKALDARNASYLALQGGIVQGAGVALCRAGDTKETLDGVGGDILASALQYPWLQIIKNMGITDMKDFPIEKNFSKVFDPAIVIKNAITNALSVASTILTAKVVITK